MDFGRIKRERLQRCIFEIITRLAQSVEHQTLNLRVAGSSPTLGVFLSI